MRGAAHIFWGFVCALIIGAMTYLFTGAGHGWTSGVYSFFPSLAGAPLAAYACAASRKVVVSTCGALSILIGLGTDIFLILKTKEEGSGYLEKVWDFMPIFLILWFLLFVGWQVVAILAMIKKRKIEPFDSPKPLSAAG